jgi:putative AdoMet-dependent methyltransferase
VSSAWIFREFEPVGVELGSVGAVADYDRNQGTDSRRDRALLMRLGVREGTRFVDLACGTGSMLVEAAAMGAQAHGVDVSEEMLRFTRHRAEERGVTVGLHREGFLSYRHHGLADVVTTKSALHQLPDFWKQAALIAISDYVRSGGLLYIWDLIFSFPPQDYASHIARLLDDYGAAGGEGFSREDFETHVREEYSTYAWILEGMLDRAGFDVVSRAYPTRTHGELVCVRRSEPHSVQAV